MSTELVILSNHPLLPSTPFAFSLSQHQPASFPVSQLFALSGQIIEVSVLASVFPVNIQGWFPLGFTDLISLQSRLFLHQKPSPTLRFESINSWVLSLLCGPTLTSIHDYRKNHALTIHTFVSKVMSLLFNMLSMFVMASLVAQTVKCLSAMPETRFDLWVGKMLWRRKWQPTPVLLPGKSHGQRSLVGYSPWGRKESDTNEWLHFTSVYVCHSFSSKEQVSFNFMAAVTICSAFGAQENKICHCFHFFPFCLPWSDGTRCRDLCFLNVGF